MRRSGMPGSSRLGALPARRGDAVSQELRRAGGDRQGRHAHARHAPLLVGVGPPVIRARPRRSASTIPAGVGVTRRSVPLCPRSLGCSAQGTIVFRGHSAARRAGRAPATAASDARGSAGGSLTTSASHASRAPTSFAASLACRRPRCARTTLASGSWAEPGHFPKQLLTASSWPALTVRNFAQNASSTFFHAGGVAALR
jgi:hypothetical protein